MVGKEILSQLKGEQVEMVTEEAQPEEPKEAKVGKQEPQVILAALIQTIIPTTTLITTEVIPPMIKITPTKVTLVIEASGSLPITLKVDKGKGIATESDHSPLKLKEQLEKDARDVELSKPEIMKVVVEVKSNQCVSDMMNSLSKKYERLKEIPKDLNLNTTLPLPEQDPSILRRKRKATELECETYIAGLHCNRLLPKGFQIVSNIQKVETKTLLRYKIMASNVKTTEN
ncbi:hypothetical protein Tco_1191991 [Tanacetum coccineum]